MGYSQVYHIDCKTDSLVSLVVSKELKLEKAYKMLKKQSKLIKTHENSFKDSSMMIDSLQKYKTFYMNAKKVLAPRIITRIEDIN